MSQLLPEISSLSTGMYGGVGPALTLEFDLFYNKFSIKSEIWLRKVWIYFFMRESFVYF